MENPNPSLATAAELRRGSLKELGTKKWSLPSTLANELRESKLLVDIDYNGTQLPTDSPYDVTRRWCSRLQNLKSVTPRVDSYDSELLVEEVFDHIRHLRDPEYPYSLEQLQVVKRSLITGDLSNRHVMISFTPTIPHCSQATLIGLTIRVKLLKFFDRRFKFDVRITPGTHNTEDAINKQLNDKERVAAALENPAVIRVIRRGMAGSVI